MTGSRALLILVPLLTGVLVLALNGDGDGALDGLDRDAHAAAGPQEVNEEPADLTGEVGDMTDSRAVAPSGRAPVTAPENATKGEEISAQRWSGRVLDPRGNSVVGATVELRGERSAGGLLSFGFGGARTLATTTTDGEGRFALTASTDEERPELRVLAPAFRILTTATEPTDLGDLMLDRASILRGVVLDATGAPVAGAQVTRRAESERRVVIGGRDDDGGGAREGHARTAEDGSFTMPHEPPGVFALEVRHADHPDAEVRGEVAPGATTDLEVRFEPAGRIEGVLTGLPDDPAGTVRVRARSVAEGGAQGPRIPGMNGAQRTVVVEDDGSFVLSGLEAGAEYEVWASQESRSLFEQAPASNTERVVAGGGAIELRFRPGGRLRFQVLDAATAEPIEALVVEHTWAEASLPTFDWGGVAQPRAHADGRVQLEQLRPPLGATGTLDLTVRSPGYLDHVTQVSVSEGADLDLGQIRLTRSGVMVVTVQDALGAPVSNATVKLVDPSGSPWQIGGPGVDDDEEGGETRGVFITTTISSDGDDEEDGVRMVTTGGSGTYVTASTDEAGLATLELPDVTTAKLVVSHPEFAVYEEPELLVPRTGHHEHPVTLSRGGRVRVTVLDAHGAPTAGVRFDHHEGRGGETAEDGSFDIDFLNPGPHHFRLQPQLASTGEMFFIRGGPGGDSDLSGWTQVLVREGERVEVVLQQAPRAVLRGRVTQRGRPLKNASLLLVADDAEGGDGDPLRSASRELESGTASTRSDLQGDYALPAVDAGRYVLVIRHADRRMDHRQVVDLREGQRELDIDLGVAIVRGRVLDEQGEPVVGARVDAQRATPEGVVEVRFTTGGPGMEPPGVLTDSDGRFEIVGVSSDSPIVVSATAADLVPARSPSIEMPEDGDRGGIELVLERGATLVIELPETADPFRMVLAVHESGQNQAEPASGTEVTLTGLAAGTWTVQCFGASGTERVEEQVEVARGDHRSLVLDGEPD